MTIKMGKKGIAKIEGYNDLLKDIKSILQKGLTKAYKAVDNIKVQTFWQIGERIAREEINQKRAGYGEEAVKRLSVDLEIHERTLYRILKFYNTYPILTTVLSELSWSHYLVLIDIKDDKQRRFYETLSVKEGWSVRELKKRINSKEFERTGKKGEVIVAIPKQLPAPEDIFKESYDWDFLELEKSHAERELESAILNKIEKILLEFGKGFAFHRNHRFLGHQKSTIFACMESQLKILIAGQYHKIDLVFYHRPLKCIVLVELKTEKFKRDFIAQMNEYLTYIREHNKLEGERDPIGLIICKEKNEEEVHYALGRLKKEIFVAEYKTKLPSEEEIKSKLKSVGNNGI